MSVALKRIIQSQRSLPYRQVLQLPIFSLINFIENEDTRVNLNENFQIKIIPQKGYAIEGVTVDQASVSDLSFEKYAASFSWYSGETNQATITISPKVVKEVLALKENVIVSYHKGMNV